MIKKKYKPGQGWFRYAGSPVWEHESGARVHSNGLCLDIAGKMLPIPAGEFSKYRRICNFNNNRAVMAWVTDNIL